MQAILTTPPNSVVLVMDGSVGQIPETMGSRAVSATESCVALGCRSAHDGPTQIQLGLGSNFQTSDQLVFQGELATPTGKLSVFSIMHDELLSAIVPSDKTSIRIFANHPAEPDRIAIVY